MRMSLIIVRQLNQDEDMNKKERAEIPQEVAASALFESDRTCCVCRVRGKAVQIHHVDEDPANNETSNLAVLCFDCHRDTQIRGGFDRKLDAAQVELYRDDWIRRVANRRSIDHGPTEVVSVPIRLTAKQPNRVTTSGQELDLALLDDLPQRRLAAYRDAQPDWDTEVTAKMVEANGRVIVALQKILVELAAFYPTGQFDGRRPDDYFKNRTQQIAQWHGQVLEPHGPGTGGTIVSIMTGGAAISSMEQLVDDMVSALTSFRDDFNLHAWRTAWRNSA